MRVESLSGKCREAALFALSAMLCAVFFSGPANARPWKPAPSAQAQDYAEILDTRASGNIIVVVWVVPQMMPVSSEGRALLDKYVVLGVVHGHVQAGGAMAFAPIKGLEVRDAKGRSLTALGEHNTPANVSTFLTNMEGGMRQAVGAMGQGMGFFAFEGGDVHACGKGGLSVRYEGETYTYVTPIPGCPAH